MQHVPRKIVDMLLSYEARLGSHGAESQEICRQLLAKVDRWLAAHRDQPRPDRAAEITTALDALASDSAVRKLIGDVAGVSRPVLTRHQQITNTGDGSVVMVAGQDLRVTGSVHAQGEDSAPAEIEDTTPQPQEDEIVCRSVDLQIRAETIYLDGKRILEYTLTSPTGAAPFRGQKFRQTLLSSPRRFQADWLKQVEKLGDGKELDNEQLLQKETTDSFESLGRFFYRQLFSVEMQAAYRRWRKPVKTLLIVSDEPWIPWEWIKPFDGSDPGEVIDDDFFCMRFRLTRWLAGVPQPIATIRGTRILHVSVEESKLGPRLSEVAREQDGLDALADRYRSVELRRLTQARYQEVIELLANGEIDLVHFGGHGDADPEQPDEAWIELTDRRLRARHLDGPLLGGIKKRRPLVFLNACRAAQQGWALTSLGGWAEAWVRRAECGAFVAPQWSVRDRLAAIFADVFYKALAAGDTIGLATRKARAKVRDCRPDHPAWLSYAVYAHPDARFRPGAPQSVQNSDARPHASTSALSPRSTERLS